MQESKRLFNIKNVVLEGPDLSGKTTLYNNIHRLTSFSWNIQDRSHMSMLCYARQYGRGVDIVDRWRDELREYLLCLNNRLIVLLPDISVVTQRLHERGDEFQNIESLLSLHAIFTEEVALIESLPNVYVLRDELPALVTAEKCVQWLMRGQQLNIEGIGSELVQMMNLSPSTSEVIGCNFQLTPLTNDSLINNSDIMRYPPEEAYYAKILSHVLANIDDELCGRNEYTKPQKPMSTRRFIFTQGSCISLIHTVLRGDCLYMNVYCRSSNVRDTFSHDLQFLYYLFGRIRARLVRTLSVHASPFPLKSKINITVGSAHIPTFE